MWDWGNSLKPYQRTWASGNEAPVFKSHLFTNFDGVFFEERFQLRSLSRENICKDLGQIFLYALDFTSSCIAITCSVYAQLWKHWIDSSILLRQLFYFELACGLISISKHFLVPGIWHLAATGRLLKHPAQAVPSDIVRLETASKTEGKEARLLGWPRWDWA